MLARLIRGIGRYIICSTLVYGENVVRPNVCDARFFKITNQLLASVSLVYMDQASQSYRLSNDG